MHLFLIFALLFTLSAQRESGNEMMKKVMSTIGEEGREKVIVYSIINANLDLSTKYGQSHLNADDFQKLMDCLESVCEMTDFRSLMKKITPIIKKVSGAKVVSKLMSMYIGDENEKESSNKSAMDAVITLPYYHPVPDGLHPGMAVYVQGAVPKDSKGFSVDFTIAKLQKANIACHFNPRFKWGNKVMFNTFESHRWKKEETRRMPFQKGEHFETIFIVTEIGYQILVNGKHFYVFRHRIPAQGVRFIKVAGDLELQSVNVTAGPMVENMTRTFPGIYHLALPHEQTVLGGLYPGMSVYVNGTVPEDSHSFRVDFACCQHGGADVPLHFSSQFFQEALVLNTFQSHKWGKEEKLQNPFQKGEPFEITFTVTETEYQILVNGNPFCNYSHIFPPQSVQLIRVAGDLDLQSLNVMAEPKMENTIMTFPAIYNPPVPYTGDIPGDLGAERTITVRGSIPKNGRRFEINFMAGQDIALHVELRMKPWRAVVRNSFLNGNWENEERKLTFYPFQPGQDFKLSIHCDNHEFKFYANDQPFFEYIHRYVPIKEIRTLEINGDVTLSYIKY